jgi:hypothetical protein
MAAELKPSLYELNTSYGGEGLSSYGLFDRLEDAKKACEAMDACVISPDVEECEESYLSPTHVECPEPLTDVSRLIGFASVLVKTPGAPWPWLLLVEEQNRGPGDPGYIKPSPAEETSTTCRKPYETWVRVKDPSVSGWACITEDEDLTFVVGDGRALSEIARDVARMSPPDLKSEKVGPDQKTKPGGRRADILDDERAPLIKKLERRWAEALK